MKFIDAHCHLCHPKLIEKIDEIVENAGEVEKAVSNGGSPEENKCTLKIAKKFPEFVVPAIGISPHYVENNSESSINEEIERVEKEIENVAAVGETGMDAHYFKNLEKQEKIFRKQIEMAEKYNKPIVVHSRDAEEKVLEVLREYKVKIMLHCFMKPELVKEASKIAYISIPTFSSSKVKEVIKKTPEHKILAETDAPFFWSGLNEPKNVVFAYKLIEKIKGNSSTINKNAKKLFNLV